MKIPVKPPPWHDVLTAMLGQGDGAEKLQQLLAAAGPSPGGKYRHWDVLRHVDPPRDLTAEEWWLGVKMARLSRYQPLPLRDPNDSPFRYAITDEALRMLHQIDRASGTLVAGSDVANPHVRDTYIIKSLIEEAITSSQLEGASTTRAVAKDMIQTGRKPRDRSERMIYNNYHAMQFIRQLRDQPLNPKIVLELQGILTDKATDDPDAAGRLRRSDEPISVVDPIGTVLHTPPPASQLKDRMQAMCDFANTRSGESFLHPIVRAAILHFWLAYDHPFVDGNGRTARALFYWSMATQGYWLFEFISISQILRKAPSKYSRAFLYTETDDNDVTYFIVYQLHVIQRAIEELHAYLERKSQELRETEELIRRSRLIRDQLNHRQLALLNHALKHRYAQYTIDSHRRSHNVSYQTARTDLLDLAARKVLDAGKIGHAFVFSPPRDLRQRLKVISEGRPVLAQAR